MVTETPAGEVDMEEVLYQDVLVTEKNAPSYMLEEREVDIWSEPYQRYHSKSPVDYVREEILRRESEGKDAFPNIVGKAAEKELVKEALFSGSPLLFRGERGYGKTTFSKSIADLLPEKILAIKGCKIYDDPTHPTCFSCKAKVLYGKTIELTWIPRIWVRIPGDPMLTTRQLIGGISIQKIREGFDLDHPEVFIPGRALKANRGVGYFDELGAVPSSLQTLLHELFEERQVSTTDGDLLPFKVSTLEIASTNPANYRGTSPIKEPLLDRMEVVEIGPPETLDEEIEIAKRNMYVVKRFGTEPKIPSWHQKILARAVRFGRNSQECEIAKKIQSGPSCRATIKVFDHLASRATRSRRHVPLLSDYGGDFEIVHLALGGRIEVEYGVKESKKQIVTQLIQEAISRTCREIYDLVPPSNFEALVRELNDVSIREDGVKFLPIEMERVRSLRGHPTLSALVNSLADGSAEDDEVYLSAVEIVLHSISICASRHVARKGQGYIIRMPSEDETGVRSLQKLG